MTKALLALDQAPNFCGWVVFIDGKFESSGVLKPDSPNYDLLRSWTKDMIGQLRAEGHDIEVAVEGIYLKFYKGKPQVGTYKMLAQCQAHIWAASREMGVPVSEITAYDAMKALTGIKQIATKSEVRKDAMVENATKRIGKKVSEHEADAYGIALAYLETKQSAP